MTKMTLWLLCGLFLSACRVIGAEPQVGIYTKGKSEFGRDEVEFISEKLSLQFVELINGAQLGRIDFKWDRRGLYILIFYSDRTLGYECKPWASGDDLVLLPVEFKIENGCYKFNRYIIPQGFLAPMLPRKILESFFPIMASLAKPRN